MENVRLWSAIIKQILLRLPVKYLLRLKSVSEELKSFLSSSEFVNEHLKISRKNNGYIKLIYGSPTIPTYLDSFPIQSIIDGNIVSDRLLFNCPFLLPGFTFTFVGSCNGLVCVLIGPHRIILWNPTTGESTLFFVPHHYIFDPGSMGLSWGFGYDEVHNDYKLVKLFRDTHLQVYSLKTNSWKSIPSNMTRWIMIINEEYGRFVHGAIHWTGYCPGRFVYSFNLATETLTQSLVPAIGADFFYELEVLRGCLAISCRCGDYLDVWLMREFGETDLWTRVLRFPFSRVSNFHNPTLHRRRLLFLFQNNRLLMHYGTTLSVCDPSDPEPQQFVPLCVVNAITYVESLVSPTTGWLNES